MHQNPHLTNPNRPPLNLYHPPHYPPHYPYPAASHPLTPHPNPNPNIQSSLKPHESYSIVAPEAALGPPGVDSYASLTSYTHGYETNAVVSYQGGPVYYLVPNVQNWAAKMAVRQYGADPAEQGGAVGVTISSNGTEELANPSSASWTNPITQSLGNGSRKKRPRKTKLVQSAYCEVCKVDCNSKDVLDQHKLGKKHKKNLEKLQETTASMPATSVGSCNQAIGPQENPNEGKTATPKKSRKKAAEPVEDLELKRRKIVESGTAAEAVRECVICNVVCNSETVFNYHLAGQKHVAMLKKHAARTGLAAAT